jgi:aryl-alcohol dehydrogenase-like predicted oxidoreductase
MQYRHLGKSGLEVSEVGLGANSFGEPNRTEFHEVKAIIHEALDCGVNFVDTSNVYASGVSEEYIGRALQGRRHGMLIGTKFGSRRQHGPNLFGGSRKFVMNAVEASLRRLQTDYIDLYMIHRPDTRMPLDETLRAMDDLVQAGKVRYIGSCNFAAWRLVEGQWITRRDGLSPIISSQYAYSLLNRSSEREMLPACKEMGIGIIPYLPLAAGMLTGKVSSDGSVPSESRLGMDRNAGARWLTPENLRLVGALTCYAERHGKTVLDLAIAWLLSEPQVSTVISGASRPGQVSRNATASEWRLTADQRAGVGRVLDENLPSTPDSYYSVAPYFEGQTVV